MIGHAALSSALLTFTAALAVRAPDPTLAVVAVALTTALLTWFATLHSTAQTSGLALANPVSAVVLAIAGRRPWGAILPLVAAQVVGAALAGLGAWALDDHLPPTLVYASPGLVTAAVAGALTGLVGTWTTFAIDGEANAAFAAAPPVLGGIVALPLVAAFHPAVLTGLAIAGLLGWGAAAVAAAACLAGGVAGAYAMNVLLPKE